MKRTNEVVEIDDETVGGFHYPGNIADGLRQGDEANILLSKPAGPPGRKVAGVGNVHTMGKNKVCLLIKHMII